MQKIILVTGSTDGIGFETAKRLIKEGHYVLLHGRNIDKLKKIEGLLSKIESTGRFESYVADLSIMSGVVQLAKEINEKHSHIDVLINNAGVYSTPKVITADNLDVRFAVNTLAPYLLTLNLLPLLSSGRVVNLSSAAQSSVDLDALKGLRRLSDGEAYAQSKLALTIWSQHLGLDCKEKGPMVVSVNPASMLGSKMVKDAFGVSGGDLSIGSDILVRAALSDEFSTASGLYFDNDIGQFSKPHPEALNEQKVQDIMMTIEATLAKITQQIHS
ncbi:SDR family NAD(P)-dependent oxidoreductase [Aliivibrio fischeri]|uniref:SDR family NAD(P)-dependent oxidoreductase n=1 Tax=Aliivibrio fischeri TaxID=668 RepID=UPI0007C58C33|nr:SDR family NAD(P)-dependent oxidoreductase [Aliivibrio fischeri]MCE7536056.1 SDR family NAD(P)-dependent oxidoreductase [Aliivibrio fischeri]MCE7558718.1 SDR family NAD(P)-dependent oxidoreductase [Aliivibrio fischeri]